MSPLASNDSPLKNSLEPKKKPVRLEKLQRIQELKAKLSPLNVDTLNKINKQRSMRLIAPIPPKSQLKPTPSPSPEPQFLNVSNGKRAAADFTPSPTPEPAMYDTEIDPDNLIIRAGSDVEEHEYDEEGRIIIKSDNED